MFISFDGDENEDDSITMYSFSSSITITSLLLNPVIIIRALNYILVTLLDFITFTYYDGSYTLIRW